MSELRWAEDVVIVEQPEASYAARMPDGPIWVLEGSAAALVPRPGAHFSSEDVADAACAAYEGEEAEIRAGVAVFLDALESLGLLERG